MCSIESILSYAMKERGFVKKGKALFFRVEKDIVLVLSVEKASLTYIWFSLIPLFLPCPGFLYLSFGNRLNALYQDIKAIEKSAEQKEIEQICEAAVRHIDNELLPFALKNSEAGSLCAYLKSDSGLAPEARDRFFSCPPVQKMRLLMYGLLYLKHFDEALKIADCYYNNLKNASIYTDDLKAKLMDECEQLMAYIHAEKYDIVDGLIRKNIEDNLGLFK